MVGRYLQAGGYLEQYSHADASLLQAIDNLLIDIRDLKSN